MSTVSGVMAAALAAVLVVDVSSGPREAISIASEAGATAIDCSSHLNGACMLDASVTLLAGAGGSVRLLGWAKTRAAAEALDNELGTYANIMAVQGEGYAIYEYKSRC